MSADQTSTLFARLRQCELLEATQLEELSRLPEASNADPRPLGRILLQRGWLTKYQINQVAQGRGKELCIGPYVLLDRIGEGGMGQVFRARHRHMQRIVALKLIRKEKLANDEAVKRFYQEIQAAAQLQDPNIVVAYDAGSIGNTHYFAMEYVEGTDLGRLVAESGPLPAALACEYTRQAALGLHHAHERGLIHRDVKPANLLVSHNAKGAAVVKVLDLGIARARTSGDGGHELTRTGEVVGTPDYLSPEQALNSRSVDARSDVYSLGCTLYYLLTGQPLFTGGSLAQVLLDHQMTEPKLPPADVDVDVPQGIWTVIRKMLAKEPAARYQSTAEVAGALRPWCDTESVASGEIASGTDAVRQAAMRPGSGRQQLARKSGDASVKSRSEDKLPAGITKGRNNTRPLLVAAGVGLAISLVMSLVIVVAVQSQRGNSGPAIPAVALSATDDSQPAKEVESPGPAVDNSKSKRPPGPPREAAAPPMTEKAAMPAPPNQTVKVASHSRNERGFPSPPPDTAAQPADASNSSPPKQITLTTAIESSKNMEAIQPLGELWADQRSGAMATKMAISRDGTYVWASLISYPQESLFWQLPSAKRLNTFAIPLGPGSFDASIVLNLVFSKDGSRALTLARDGRLRIRQLPGGQLIGQAFGPGRTRATVVMALSDDGQLAATGHGSITSVNAGKANYDGCGVCVWDVATGKATFQSNSMTMPVDQVAFSPDGRRLYCSQNMITSHTIEVYDTKDGTPLSKFKLPQRRVFPRTISPSQDGRTLLIGCHSEVSMLNAETGIELLVAKSSENLRFVSWCGPRHFLTCGQQYDSAAKKWMNIGIAVWEADTCTQVRRLQGHTQMLSSLAASADGQYVVAGCQDGKILLWHTGL